MNYFVQSHQINVASKDARTPKTKPMHLSRAISLRDGTPASFTRNVAGHPGIEAVPAGALHVLTAVAPDDAEVAMAALPFSPVKFSALIDLDFAFEVRQTLCSPTPKPLNSLIDLS